MSETAIYKDPRVKDQSDNFTPTQPLPESEMDTLRRYVATVKAQRDQAVADLGDLQDKYNALEDTAGDQGDKIERLEAENSQLREELRRLKESANRDRDILNIVVEAVGRRGRE